MRKRDERDSTRESAPLVCAPDAVVVDSSGLSVDDVVREMLGVVRERERVAAGQSA
jgi:cytidylate kinase